MKTTEELEKGIVDATLKIHTEFPEFTKHMGEMIENSSVMGNNQAGIKNLKQYYNSLEQVVLEYAQTHLAEIPENGSETLHPEGYPLYPPSEDIYNQQEKEQNVNPADISKVKKPTKTGIDKEVLGDDLDVPGSELDDQQESVGSEDEENNYYSLGGDNHDN